MGLRVGKVCIQALVRVRLLKSSRGILGILKGRHRVNHRYIRIPGLRALFLTAHGFNLGDALRFPRTVVV